MGIMAKKSNDGSLQTTKQMLDELDALMEQMLALPVNEPDAVPPFPKSVVKGPNLAATLTLLNPPPEEKPAIELAAQPEAKSPPQPSATVEPKKPKQKLADAPVAAPPAPPPKAKPEQWKTHPVLNPPHVFNQPSESDDESEETEQPQPLTNTVLPPSALARIEPLLAEVPETSTPTASNVLHAPLVWVNEAFDAVTSIFWGTGWTRVAAGRLFLGVSGIVLILVAIGWALVDWKGWHW